MRSCKDSLGTPNDLLLDSVEESSYGSGMGKIARVVVPGCARHLTQRGTRATAIFCDDEHPQLHLRPLAEQGEAPPAQRPPSAQKTSRRPKRGE